MTTRAVVRRTADAGLAWTRQQELADRAAEESRADADLGAAASDNASRHVAGDVITAAEPEDDDVVEGIVVDETIEEVRAERDRLAAENARLRRLLDQLAPGWEEGEAA